MFPPHSAGFAIYAFLRTPVRICTRKPTRLYVMHITGMGRKYGNLSMPSHAQDDFWESIFACIEVGGDTDSVASMCGALAGAYNGFERIVSSRDDSRYVIDAIQDSDAPGTANVNALRNLAKNLHKVATKAASKL